MAVALDVIMEQYFGYQVPQKCVLATCLSHTNKECQYKLCRLASTLESSEPVFPSSTGYKVHQ